MSGHSFSTSANDRGGVVIDDDFLAGVQPPPLNVHTAQLPVKRESGPNATAGRNGMKRRGKRRGDPTSERLRALRKTAGFPSAAAAARAMPGVHETTYQQHENGQRPLTHIAAAAYAAFFGVPAGYILFGERLQGDPEVPIVGVIGPGGAIVEVRQDADSYTSGPANTGLAAYRVIAKDLWPAYHEDDLAFFSPRALAQPIDPAAVNGHECIVVLTDGTRLLRFVTMIGAGIASLMAYSGPPMMNVEISAAAPVLWIKRAGSPF